MILARVGSDAWRLIAASLPTILKHFGDSMYLSRKLFFALILLALASAGLPACSSQAEEVHLNMTSMNVMPAEVRSAPVTVQQAYQFASANPDLMKNIPCYCGCGNMGHGSNYACYVSEADGQGNLTFDNHALGCSICVDITQDAMRLLRQGKSPGDIRTYVDTKYSQYGPSNIP
jgi:hypothetical protein